jgi:fructose-1,6-bisphosphatase/inositol monophosphatase family enzyme
VNTEAILALLRDVADEVINPRFRSLADGQVKEKNPGDLVTVADHEAEALITEALLMAYPDAVVLGEEAFAADPALLQKYAAADHAFTVDPVDGTKNFVHGSKDHAVMVAELRAGTVVRSWIWQPQHELGYTAELGAGAWVNGHPLTRPAPARLEREWRGVTSRRKWVGRELPGLRPLELTWVCCGVDYPHLVAGHADFVLSGRDNPWDHAPGSLILGESGGYLGTLDGGPYDPRVSGGGLIGAADRATYDVVLERFHSS